MVLGPPVAGILIATVGLPLTYGVDVATFVVSAVALTLMRAVPPAADAAGANLRAAIAGLRYAMSRQDLLGSYAVDINAMFFGMPMALFPQIASGLGGPAVLGLLYTAPSVGSLLATVTSGWTRRVRHHGRAIASAAAAWGVAIIAFGIAPALWVALLALAAAGAADMVSGLFRSALWNQTIPDAMRGRLAGIEMVSYSSGPAMGNLESGVVGSLAGVRASVVSGGILCVVGTVVLSALLPKFWNYRTQPTSTTARQRSAPAGARPETMAVTDSPAWRHTMSDAPDSPGDTSEPETADTIPDESTLMGSVGVEAEVLAELARAQAKMSDPSAPDDPDAEGAQV
jgi:hypothetical protein